MDIYGNVRSIEGNKTFIPFRYQGQYEDEETGLYYNRFRYYSADSGMYISKDPFSLKGNNPSQYGYTVDSNSWIDIFGLSGIPLSDELAQIARDAHDVLKDRKSNRAFNSRTVSVAEVQNTDGTKSLFASGNDASLTPAQRQSLINSGVPEENILSGKRFRDIIEGNREATKLANHEERVIERNLKRGQKIIRFGISWASKQRNEMCNNCKKHFKSHH